MKTKPKYGFPTRAFTLVELLTAIAVLSVILLLLSQMIGLSSQTATDGQTQIDDFSKARLALDVFSEDVRSAVLRNDLGAFLDNNGNYSNTFYSRRIGASGDRQLSLIDYKFMANNGSLQRASIAVSWTDTFPGGMGFNNTSSIPRYAQITTSDYDDLADGVVAMQIYFIDLSGNYQTTYTTNTRLVGIALAVVDRASLNLLTANGQLNKLESSFPAQSPLADTYNTFWEGKISTATFFSSYPKQLRPGLRIFERTVATL